MTHLSLEATGELPRLVTPDLLWTGGCLEVAYKGGMVHGHFSTFLLKGSEKTILVDTGHPKNWATIERDVDAFLDGRPLDYLFPTHAEFPHSGLFPNWMAKYPDLVAVGDLRDYDLYYPELTGRLKHVEPGHILDLGDKRLMFIPAIWRDMPSTMWAFEMVERMLFVADAFAFLHYHKHGQCDLMTSEQPIPDVQMMQFFNERALQWTRYTDVSQSFGDIDTLVRDLQPRLIVGAHAGIIDTRDAMVPVIKRGMMSGAMAGGFEIQKVVA
jgi:hypothetical protein